MTAVPSIQTIAKAAGLLEAGRVRIHYADDVMVSATVRGGRRYEVSFAPVLSEWSCSCPANTLAGHTCSHILAVAAVWAPANANEAGLRLVP